MRRRCASRICTSLAACSTSNVSKRVASSCGGAARIGRDGRGSGDMRTTRAAVAGVTVRTPGICLGVLRRRRARAKPGDDGVKGRAPGRTLCQRAANAGVALVKLRAQRSMGCCGGRQGSMEAAARQTMAYKLSASAAASAQRYRANNDWLAALERPWRNRRRKNHCITSKRGTAATASANGKRQRSEGARRTWRKGSCRRRHMARRRFGRNGLRRHYREDENWAAVSAKTEESGGEMATGGVVRRACCMRCSQAALGGTWKTGLSAGHSLHLLSYLLGGSLGQSCCWAAWRANPAAARATGGRPAGMNMTSGGERHLHGGGNGAGKRRGVNASAPRCCGATRASAAA